MFPDVKEASSNKIVIKSDDGDLQSSFMLTCDFVKGAVLLHPSNVFVSGSNKK